MKPRFFAAAGRLATQCVCVVSLAAQASVSPTAPLPPAIVQLARIKQHAIETLTKQPNYTCLESIERARRTSKARDFRTDDTLRLEVAWIDGKELFAWPGATQFDDKDIRELVPTGAISSGDFALHAHTVFATAVPTYEARGEEELGDRTSVRYDYRVPRLFSGYSIRIRNAEAVVGYHGSFWVDPVSLDLLRLDVVPDDLPPELDLQSASQRMEYARVPIGGRDFLLPASSEMVLVHADRSATRNRVQFTSCHEYAGQSTVRFEEPVPRGDSSLPRKLEVSLPPGLTLNLRLVDEIDTGTAAIGDPVHARLVHDLKTDGQVVLRKGTMVSGRISRLEQHPNYTVLGLMLREADSTRTHAVLALEFDRFLDFGPRLWNGQWAPDVPPVHNESLIPLPPGRVRLRQNQLMRWRT